MLAQSLLAEIREGRTRPTQVVAHYLERIATHNPGLNALIRTNPGVLEEAQQVEQRLARGEELPLAGLPVALKDNICTRGLTTTCASRILENFVPPYNATVVNRLRQAGAVVIAKANLDEFAMGSSTEYSAFGPTHNPWNLDRVAGGSSGGPAAAVAANLAPLALGSDTGGSVRQPASLCGIYGFKPTYGRISRYGLVAYASSLDQIGPMAQNVADLALLSDVVCATDPLDSTSLEAPPQFTQALRQPVAGLTVGLVSEAMAAGNSPGVLEAIQRFRQTLEPLGVRFVEVSIPTLQYALAAYYLVAVSEASSNLARYDGMLYGLRVPGVDLVDTMRNTRAAGFGSEVKRRILMGTFALSSGYYEAYYGKALRARARIKADFDTAFAQVDLLLTPTSPFPAWPLGAKTDDPLAMYLADIDTVAVNLIGAPALSIPAGLEDGLPVGVQLVAPPLADERLFSLAAAFERATSAAHCGTAPRYA
jgi:aspartyl-tRNA(Asn)/glutamyl-tRNA(Gln) amidotransferase subunit A